MKRLPADPVESRTSMSLIPLGAWLSVNAGSRPANLGPTVLARSLPWSRAEPPVRNAFHKKTQRTLPKDLQIAKRRFGQLLGGRI